MLRPLTIGDIPELERVQNTTLPGSLPTLFGSRFFGLYYRSLMADSRFLCTGFFWESQMAGFLSYSTDSSAILSAALRRHLAGYVVTVGAAMAVRPAVIGTTLRLLPGLLAPGRQPGPDVRAELLSYGVLSDYRRRTPFFTNTQVHVAHELLHHAFCQLRDRGARQVRVFIQTEEVNALINDFYRKEGFNFVSRARRFGVDCNYYIRNL